MSLVIDEKAKAKTKDANEKRDEFIMVQKNNSHVKNKGKNKDVKTTIFKKKNANMADLPYYSCGELIHFVKQC